MLLEFLRVKTYVNRIEISRSMDRETNDYTLLLLYFTTMNKNNLEYKFVVHSSFQVN